MTPLLSDESPPSPPRHLSLLFTPLIPYSRGQTKPTIPFRRSFPRRRSPPLLAQVRFFLWDLRRKTAIHAFQWRRSHPYFHTCASYTKHLRHLSPCAITLMAMSPNQGHHRRLTYVFDGGVPVSGTSPSVGVGDSSKGGARGRSSAFSGSASRREGSGPCRG